jgi:hypothetical protein
MFTVETHTANALCNSSRLAGSIQQPTPGSNRLTLRQRKEDLPPMISPCDDGAGTDRRIWHSRLRHASRSHLANGSNDLGPRFHVNLPDVPCYLGRARRQESSMAFLRYHRPPSQIGRRACLPTPLCPAPSQRQVPKEDRQLRQGGGPLLLLPFLFTLVSKSVSGGLRGAAGT